ncbi:MAG TPA: 2-phosphosulfolactate phosphatase [Acidimicrobiales bacterium]|nr:2-phosphosulfolactate phosphatase [Acidimicrobiales bacterium]
MAARAARWAGQKGFGVRLSWGPAGIEALAHEVAVLVLVDVLRFGTALDVATASGAAVRPAPWPFDPEDQPAHGGAVEVADGSGRRRLGLSPGSLAVLGPDDLIVLPSANGSHCSALAARSGAVVVAASLRNATAVARYAARVRGPGAVGVVPCGEVWPGGGLRPAVEDLLGAGAVVAALTAAPPSRSCAPEAAAAMAAFCACDDLAAALGESESGRELRDKGLSGDVAWAAALDVSNAVPVLGADGAYRSERLGV